MAEGTGISARAVLIGFAADVGATFAFGVALVVGLTLQGAPPDGLEGRLVEPDALALSMCGGLACTALGGFIAGRVARRAPVRHAALVGVVGVAFGLLFLGSYPLWYSALGAGGTVPAAAFGGWLAAAGRREPTADPDGPDGGGERGEGTW